MNKKDMKEYRIWRAMKARCYAPSQKGRGIYQKVGIQVCDRWKDSFENFLADMGAIPADDYSIERIDNLGDYCPENCIWIPLKEQMKNRSNVPVYTYKGETHCLLEWSRILNINIDLLRGRIRRGVSFERAICGDIYNRQIFINGESKTVKEWCEYYSINSGCVYSRVHRGWTVTDAILKDQDKIKFKKNKED